MVDPFFENWFSGHSGAFQVTGAIVVCKNNILYDQKLEIDYTSLLLLKWSQEPDDEIFLLKVCNHISIVNVIFGGLMEGVLAKCTQKEYYISTQDQKVMGLSSGPSKGVFL